MLVERDKSAARMCVTPDPGNVADNVVVRIFLFYMHM